MVEVGRATGRAHQVATVNVDFVVNAADDPETARILQRTDLAIPDGMPRRLGARARSARRCAQRTTGVDLLPALVERAADSGLPRLPLRRRPRRRRRALPSCSAERFPAPRSSDSRHPTSPPTERWTERRSSALRRRRVPTSSASRSATPSRSAGSPATARRSARRCSSGSAGTLDFLTGVTRRAPAWMQRSGLEWLHRAVSEPRRLAGRYAQGPRGVRCLASRPRRGAGVGASAAVAAGGRCGRRGDDGAHRSVRSASELEPSPAARRLRHRRPDPRPSTSVR